MQKSISLPRKREREEKKNTCRYAFLVASTLPSKSIKSNNWVQF